MKYNCGLTMEKGSHNTIKKNQKFTTGKKGPKRLVTNAWGPRWVKQKSSEDDQNKPTHDSRYVYKEETLGSRYQVKEQTCDSPCAEK